MDIGKAFTFAFDDEGWLTKVLIGGLFSLLSGILIGVPFIVGYYLETLKNVYLGNPRPMPNWGDNTGALFGKGLKAVVGVFVWALPALLVYCVATALTAVAPGSNTSQGAQGPLAWIAWCLFCLMGVYSLVISVIMPAALMKFAVSEQLGDFFRFGELFGFISRNLGNYIIAIIVYWLASMVGSLGVILCFIGAFFTSFWAMLVGAHLFGQVYRAAKA